jgi:hypothetical protein
MKFMPTFVKTLIKIWCSILKDFLNSTFQSQTNFVLLRLINEQNVLPCMKIRVLQGSLSPKTLGKAGEACHGQTL